MENITATTLIVLIATFFFSNVATNLIKQYMDKKVSPKISDSLKALQTELKIDLHDMSAKLTVISNNQIAATEKYKSLDIRMSNCENDSKNITKELHLLSLEIERLKNIK